ncbi:MAG: hypothetical protein JWN48_126 [Myxococcaceae bacterium]|nr:hypothetical protein [Myxococcaceae bacterium]
MLYFRPVSDEFRWASVIAKLERVFAELGMRSHAERLARFKAAYERQSKQLEADPRGRARPWTTEDLVKLASVFHVEPFAKLIPLVPDDKRCPYCRTELAGRNAAPVVDVYMDRTLYQCRKCARRWLLMKK